MKSVSGEKGNAEVIHTTNNSFKHNAIEII